MSQASRADAVKAHRARLYAEGRDWWSAERDAYLRAHYPCGMPAHEMLPVLEAMPGKSLGGNVDRIHGRANDIGLKRKITAHAPSGRWPAEREAMLRELWCNTTLPWQKIMARLNALPAAIPIGDAAQLHRRASKLGLKRTAEAVSATRRVNGLLQNQRRPPKPPKVKAERVKVQKLPPSPEIAKPIIRYDHGYSIGGAHPAAEVQMVVVDDPATADAALARKLDRARAMLRQKKDPTAISGAVRLPLREVFRLQGEIRRGAP